MTIDTPARAARLQHALGALELAAIRHRRDVRQRLRVGDDELSVLLYLAHHGGASQRHLTGVTSLSRSGAGALLQRLEERGYVQRRTDPADRRLRLVELSPDGRERLDRAYAGLAAAIAHAVAACDDAEVEACAGLLSGIARAAEPEEERRLAAVTGPQDPIWRRWG